MTVTHKPFTPGNNDLVKVLVELPPADWHSYGSETLWAAPVGPLSARLRNVPFYAKGFSFDDEVLLRKHSEELIVENVGARGGHSTYRIFASADAGVGTGAFSTYWLPIAEAGATYEAADERLIAVDVPPESDIYLIYSLLEKGEHAGVWDFQEAHCGHALDGAPPG